MSDPTTPNLGLSKPVVNADADTWGTTTNADWDIVDAFAGTLMPQAEAVVASASTIDIGDATSTAVAISGTATITSFGVVPNCIRFCRITGATLIITRNATTLETPTQGNIQAALGDTFIARSDASGNWRIVQYTRGVSTAVATFSGLGVSSIVACASVSLAPGKWKLSCDYNEDGGTGGDDVFVINTTSGSLSGTLGQNSQFCAVSSNGRGGASITGFIVTLTATTIYWLNAQSNISGPSASGTLRAEPII